MKRADAKWSTGRAFRSGVDYLSDSLDDMSAGFVSTVYSSSSSGANAPMWPVKTIILTFFPFALAAIVKPVPSGNSPWVNKTS